MKFGAAKNIQWSFIMAASQHQNGISRIILRLAKAVKMKFLKVFGDTRLSLKETYMMLAKIANLIN